MAATTFADLAEMYIQGEKAVHPIDAPTPDQLRVMLAQLVAQFIPNGWSLGTTDVQATIDKTVAEYTVTYNGWHPAPVQAAPDNPLVYDFGDGSFMPSNASLAGKTLGDSLVRPEATYKLVNFPSGIMSYAPRWVKQ